MTTQLKQAAQKALEAREEAFQRWFMLQSKMPYRNPQEIAGMAWHAAMEHVHALLGAAFVPQPTDAGAQELPDAIRVPLDELEADARYLAARLANGTMAPSVGAEAIQKRTRAIREALSTSIATADAGAQACGAVNDLTWVGPATAQFDAWAAEHEKNGITFDPLAAWLEATWLAASVPQQKPAAGAASQACCAAGNATDGAAGAGGKA